MSLLYEVTRKLLSGPSVLLRSEASKDAERSCCGTRTRYFDGS